MTNNTFIQRVAVLFVLGLTSLFLSTSLYAASPSGPTPVGVWKSYDDDGTLRSLVQITGSGGSYSGSIAKVIAPRRGKPMSTVGANGRPLQGMTVLRVGASGNEYDGTVVDSDSGKTYSCIVTISPDNRTLYLHAYVGTPMFGKTVNWYRVR